MVFEYGDEVTGDPRDVEDWAGRFEVLDFWAGAQVIGVGDGEGGDEHLHAGPRYVGGLCGAEDKVAFNLGYVREC